MTSLRIRPRLLAVKRPLRGVGAAGLQCPSTHHHATASSIAHRAQADTVRRRRFRCIIPPRTATTSFPKVGLCRAISSGHQSLYSLVQYANAAYKLLLLSPWLRQIGHRCPFVALAPENIHCLVQGLCGVEFLWSCHCLAFMYSESEVADSNYALWTDRSLMSRHLERINGTGLGARIFRITDRVLQKRLEIKKY